MQSKKTSAIHRTLAVGLALVTGAVLIGSPAFADDPDPDAQDGSCRAAVVALGKSAQTVLKGGAKDDANALPGKHQAMRSACEPFRSCKKSCRQAKRDAKSACKGLKGKAKRACKKKAKKTKRSCKAGCREEMKQSGCRTARRDFWKGMGKVAKKVVKDKKVRKDAKAAVKACKALYKKD